MAARRHGNRRWRGSRWRWPILLVLAGCVSNSPYPASDERANVLYTTFTDEPRHLDPAQAYGGVAYNLICHIVEPPFQYNLLKRPYVLEPRTATAVPRPETRKVAWQGKAIDAVVYTIHLKPGIRYQHHPCFVEANRHLSRRDARGIRGVADFEKTAAREAVASDFTLAVRRLTDPRLTCPIIGTLKQNILGLEEYGEALSQALDAERERRREAVGPLYSREQDEKFNPIKIDYMAFPLPG
ncbi:peptide ABC transporter substrate-binding protein, partial [Planctomycetota bacterium]